MPDIRIPAGILTVRGPIREISVRGTRWRFEMHSYCGPMFVDMKGDALKREPPMFVWEAVTVWAQQGERLEPRPEPNPPLCVWDHEPEPITEHLGGKNYKVVGYKPAKKGD